MGGYRKRGNNPERHIGQERPGDNNAIDEIMERIADEQQFWRRVMVKLVLVFMVMRMKFQDKALEQEEPDHSPHDHHEQSLEPNPSLFAMLMVVMGGMIGF